MNTKKLRWKKRKYFIKINCGIMAALFVAILLLMGFPIVSNAEGNDVYLSDLEPDIDDKIITQSGYQSYNPDFSTVPYYQYVLSSTSNHFLSSVYYDGDLTNGEAKVDISSLPNNTLYTDYPIHFLYYSSGKNYLCLARSVNSSYYGTDINVYYLCANYYNSVWNGLKTSPKISNYTSSVPMIEKVILTYNTTTNTFVYNSTDNLDRRVVGDQIWSPEFGKDSSGKIFYANCPLYVYNKNFDNSYVIEDYLEDLTNVNYMYSESSEDETYPDGSGGEVINNMYMRTADWKFNIPQYWTNTNFVSSNPTDKWGSGNVQFYGLVNDFQNANVSDYNLKFDYYLQLVGSYDGGISFAHSYALRSVNYPLSDFLSNNNTYQVGVDYIFTNATDINGNNIYTTLNDLRGGNISQVNFSKWELSCSAHLVSGNYTSGSIQETYSFLTQISKEVNNTITENNNPYYPPDYDDTSSSNNNNSVVTSKDGQIVLTNYDNDSLVIDNGHDEVIDTLYDKLVPENVSGESGLTQRFISLTNANKWFDVMKASLAIFPQEFWTTIYTIFLASLGVIGTAFLLWIVVHIL